MCLTTLAVLALAAPGAAAFSLGCEEGPLFRACKELDGELPDDLGDEPPPPPGVPGLSGLPTPPEPPAPPAPPAAPGVPTIPRPGACGAAPHQLPLGLGNVDALETVADPRSLCVDLLA